jgi:hypothetical protein
VQYDAELTKDPITVPVNAIVAPVYVKYPVLHVDELLIFPVAVVTKEADAIGAVIQTPEVGVYALDVIGVTEKIGAK